MLETEFEDVALETLTIHPLCAAFPPMSAEELEHLTESIREHGLREPIVLHEGQVVDGRHRLQVCKAVGVEPDFVPWDGRGSLADFVLDKNLDRRHLTQSQIAAVVADMAEYLSGLKREIDHAKQFKGSQAGQRGGRGHTVDASPQKGLSTNGQTLSGPPGRDLSPARNWSGEAARKHRAGRTYVHDAARIKEESPETFAQIKAGAETITHATRRLKKAGLLKSSKKGKAKPTPVPGQTRVNGELQDDPPEIAADRAAGRIQPGVIPEITDNGESQDAESLREAIEERKAIQEEALTDDAWLASLPLSQQLTERSLKRFQVDALFFRNDVAPDLKKLGRKLKPIYKAYNKSLPAYMFMIRRCLGIYGPEHWTKCPPVDKGGCDGHGTIENIGECSMCWSNGYLVKGEKR